MTLRRLEVQGQRALHQQLAKPVGQRRGTQPQLLQPRARGREQPRVKAPAQGLQETQNPRQEENDYRGRFLLQIAEGVSEQLEKDDGEFTVRLRGHQQAKEDCGLCSRRAHHIIMTQITI